MQLEFRETLGERINKHSREWLKEFKLQAEMGDVDGMIWYAKLLFKGNKRRPPDAPHAIYWLRKAARTNHEAAFRVAKIFLKGKYVKSDPEKAYLYFRIASLSRCKCGKYSEELHSKRISNVHSCIHNESLEAIKSMKLSDADISRYEVKFISWKNDNLK
ncbi:unnamed protein product [Blepharisma stoltei]|uniref:Sel1 repeat family protein n=1 Tax=Blepharisma stoltei TaxID=1481888 RepID=A0AAU9IF06_9CILI|nr:unnamed protein product [Blepharisma stoltei]